MSDDPLALLSPSNQEIFRLRSEVERLKTELRTSNSMEVYCSDEVIKLEHQVERLTRERDENLERALTQGRKNLELIRERDTARAATVAAEQLAARLREALEHMRIGLYNLIDMKVFPHSGWDDATKKYIAEIDQALQPVEETK